ncbi:MAG: hypothetical protein R8J94_14740 [Acidimicrobiia bacterium]|nr:hypothetical protein [Acidimicrobiia bacterium]
MQVAIEVDGDADSFAGQPEWRIGALDRGGDVDDGLGGHVEIGDAQPAGNVTGKDLAKERMEERQVQGRRPGDLVRRVGLVGSWN